MTSRPSHILIVDDSSEIRDPLSRYLRENGYRVSSAANTKEARKVLEKTFINLIILDVMMPEEDGLQFCSKLRGKSQIPIIFLSARIAEIDRIIGLELGGDDYVTKPFSPRELLARIQAVLKRLHSAPLHKRDDASHQYTFGNWIYDSVRQELKTTKGVTTILSTTEAKLLNTFLHNPNATLTRFNLIQNIYGDRGEDKFDRCIDTYVSRLRRKLAGKHKAREYITTVWGSGYALIADVKKL